MNAVCRIVVSSVCSISVVLLCEGKAQEQEALAKKGCDISSLNEGGLRKNSLNNLFQGFPDYNVFSRRIELNRAEEDLLGNAILIDFQANDPVERIPKKRVINIIPNMSELFTVRIDYFWMTDDSSPNAYATSQLFTESQRQGLRWDNPTRQDFVGEVVEGRP